MEPQHILIVDDESQVLGLFMRALTREGYIVTGTTDGNTAVRLAVQIEPDVMVTDISMPTPNGFEILNMLRVQAPHLKVVVISGSMQGVLLNSAKLFGAAATLEKPVDPELLLRTIRQILGGQATKAATAREAE